MPIYEYLCGACSTHFERYVRAFGEEVACPECRSSLVEKAALQLRDDRGALGRPAAAAPRRLLRRGLRLRALRARRR